MAELMRHYFFIGGPWDGRFSHIPGWLDRFETPTDLDDPPRSTDLHTYLPNKLKIPSGVDKHLILTLSEPGAREEVELAKDHIAFARAMISEDDKEFMDPTLIRDRILSMLDFTKFYREGRRVF